MEQGSGRGGDWVHQQQVRRACLLNGPLPPLGYLDVDIFSLACYWSPRPSYLLEAKLMEWAEVGGIQMSLASNSLGGFLYFGGSSTFCSFTVGCRKQIFAR